MSTLSPLGVRFEVQSMSEKDFSRTLVVLNTGIQDQVSPGFVAGLWHKQNPNQIFLHAVGHRRKVPSPLPMETETVFDLASVSKVMATAALAAVLVERGWISWSTPVREVLPEYSYSNIRVSHLLSHTAGYAAWLPLFEKIRDRFVPRPLYQVDISARQEAMKELILNVKPETGPGEKAVYSDLGFILLGFVLEKVAQMPLDQAVRRFVWKPMEIQGAHYRKIIESPEKDVDPTVAATQICPWRGSLLQGQVDDENCWAMGGIAGHAGVFAKAQDVLQFARALLLGFLSQKTLKEAWTRVDRPSKCDRTLGWDTPSGSLSSSGILFSATSVGHLGFTGTSLWIDPADGLAVVLLSNRIHPSRENILIRSFRPTFHDAIRLDLIR